MSDSIRSRRLLTIRNCAILGAVLWCVLLACPNARDIAIAQSGGLVGGVARLVGAHQPFVRIAGRCILLKTPGDVGPADFVALADENDVWSRDAWTAAVVSPDWPDEAIAWGGEALDRLRRAAPGDPRTYACVLHFHRDALRAAVPAAWREQE